MAAMALVLLTVVVWVGTSLGPLSAVLLGRRITVGSPFYNRAAAPVAIVLLTATGLAPLIRWGGPPRPIQRRGLLLSLVAGAGAAIIAWGLGVRAWLGLAVAGLAAVAVAALAYAIALDCRPRLGEPLARRLVRMVGSRRRRYAAYVMHLGFVSLLVGVAGSSLGSRSHEATLARGDVLEWSGCTIRLADLLQRPMPHEEKLVVEARLEISRGDRAPAVLRPAQHFHVAARQWTAEVAIDSAWDGDWYAILHQGTAEDGATVTILFNPLVRWIWVSGFAVALGAVLALWPARKSAA
jgi:cytochrome c-type biogenesis protein CcmF